MRSFKLLFDRRAQIVVAAAALLLSAIVPALASAAQLTSRSIELSSASKDADNVTYAIHFTTNNATATAVVIEFCSDSPLYGATCTPPTGFDVSGASATGWTKDTDPAHTTVNKITLNTGTTIAGANTITLTGVNNPTDAGHLYARIATYASDATGYTTADPDAGADHLDDGAIAMDIVDSIGVSAAVLETMTFCVSAPNGSNANPIAAGCTGTLLPPTLVLGETTGTVKALDAQHVSTGDIFTQLSTNASGGAVVSLKSGVACGGLKRASAADCDIVPAQQTNIAFGEAKFGVKVNPDSITDGTLSATGTLQIFPTSGYDATAYALNYNSDTSSGVTSAYGDPILDTDSTQPSNRNMKLTFGASIAPNTPAGLYKGDLSLIATGTF